MSSRKDSKDRKSIERNYLEEVAVNPQDTQGVSKSDPIQINDHSCKEEASLMDQVLSRENMLKALKRVEKNKGAAGVDKMEANELRQYLKVNWLQIKKLLESGKYKPQVVKRVTIPKPNGGKRNLGIPTVTDRLIQQAITQVLTPIYDPRFSEHSYGFRPNRSAHQAILKSQEYIQAGYSIVVDIDLEKFFDKVNHDKLMSILARDIKDKVLLKTIRAYLNAGIMEKGCCIKNETGIPQGGPLSPLLANIMLDGLDVELEWRGHKFVRYADDCNIYVKSKRAGERVMNSVKKLIATKLKLRVNEEKSAVDKPSKRKFLGMSFTPDRKARIRVAPKSIQKFKDKIRQITNRRIPISLKARIMRLNQLLRGWINYYKIVEASSVFKKLDSWIRRRLRMCVLTQWKKPKTRIKRLIRLGISEEKARLISSSGKGNWRLSRTPQLNKALSLKYWKDQKLISLSKTHERLCEAL